MKGKFHTEEAVKPILQRKGIVVKEFDYDENGNQLVIKELGIPANVFPGNKILGKLDYMRKMGWKVLKLEQMTETTKVQKKAEDTPKFKQNKKFIKKMRD